MTSETGKTRRSTSTRGTGGDATACRRRGSRHAGEGALDLCGPAPQIPVDRKDFVEVQTNRHGDSLSIAGHSMPANAVFGMLDALDWYGTWMHLDELKACSIDEIWCEYALGNTPARRFMGIWSDGVPVIELKVTDDPGTLAP